MDHPLRPSLIEALKARSWTHLDAERVAIRIEASYKLEAGEWKVVLWEVAGGEQNLYLVARKVNEVSVFDSSLEGRARDVASALNELEGHDSDATGTP